MKRVCALLALVVFEGLRGGGVPPVIREADVVVVGGTVDGVRAAVAARAAGASVFLVAPRAYLGEDRAGAFQLERLPSDDASDPVIREIFNPLYAPPKPLKATVTKTAQTADQIVQVADLGSVQLISGVSLNVPTHVRQDAAFRRNAPDLFATERVVFELSDDGVRWMPYADLTRADNAYGQRKTNSPFARRAPARCRYVRATQTRERDYPRQEVGRLVVQAPVPTQLRRSVTPFLIKRGLDKSLLAAGVPFLTGYPATDVLIDAAGRPASVVVASRNGFQSICAKVVIDATLRGRMAERAGATRLPFPAGARACSFTVVGSKGEVETRALSLSFGDGSQLAFLAAEHAARDQTWSARQGDSADHVLVEMPDRIERCPAGLFVVGPCAPQGTQPGDVGRLAAQAAAKTQLAAPDAIRPARPDLPLLATFDVVVAGGGTGGAPAAIGAARKGAKTVVLEFLDRLGGQTTEGRITGYFFGNRVGFTSEIDAGRDATGAVKSAAKAEWFRRAVREAGGEVWFGAFAAGVRTAGGRVTGVVTVLADGTCGIVACRTAIDATGNADLAAAAGCETEFITADELSVQGVGQAPQTPGGGGSNSDIGFLNDSDAEDLFFFGLRSRLSLPDSTWDQAQIPGSRERRRLKGAFYVTPSDVMLERTYPDTICRTYSNFDTHGQTRAAQFFIEDPPHNPMYVNLPYRALLPKKLEGLLVVGLGMSAHRDAMPILRMEPDVQNQGYAAGVASAMAVAEGVPVRAVNVRALQGHLVEKNILPPGVLEMTDSFPPSDSDFDRAVASLADGYAGLAVLFADPARAVPRLKAAWRRVESPEAKLVYAHVLGMMGDRTGEETLLAKFRASAWDAGWNYRGMSQFMRSVSWTDSYAIALGRSRSVAAIQPLIEKAAQLTPESEYSHYRAIALALESIGDVNTVPALERLLKLPGVGGHALAATAPIPPIRNYSNREGDRERTRVLRELCLARAIFNLGDTPEGLGRRTLEAYAADPRRAYATHARLVLKGGK
ncbi:MAG: FAD-dependent oxidoreductase [Kiritimatiellia bacterium]